MKDIPEKLAEFPTKLTGSFIRNFLKYRYRKTLLRLNKGEGELPEGTAKARLIMLHGYSKHAETLEMQRLRHVLKLRGKCDIFYCDLPYHGLSVLEGKEHLRGKIKFFGRIVEAVYALTLKALARPYLSPIATFLVGYSAGALAAIRFLQENPALQKYIAGVICISTPLRLDHNAHALIHRYKKYIEGVARWASYVPYLSEITVGDIGVGDPADVLEHQKTIDLRSAMELHVATIEAKRNLHKIAVPILFLHGAKDRTAPIADVREAYAMVATKEDGKRMIVYPESEHGLLDGHRSHADVTEDILKWIDEEINRKEWEPVVYENIAEETMELTSDTYFFIARRLYQIRRIMLRFFRALLFWK